MKTLAEMAGSIKTTGTGTLTHEITFQVKAETSAVCAKRTEWLIDKLCNTQEPQRSHKNTSDSIYN